MSKNLHSKAGNPELENTAKIKKDGRNHYKSSRQTNQKRKGKAKENMKLITKCHFLSANR
jgi:hypothetical protein